MEIRNCLLTGGRGYIGTNFAKLLNEKGIEPFFVDKSQGLPAEQLTVLKEVDYIVHLAAYPGVKPCKENLQAATIDNLSSAFRVFHLAFSMGIPVMFMSSQAAVNPEDSLYGTIKKMIEIEAGRLNYLNGDFRVLRLANVYGGEQYLEKKQTVVANFINTIKRGEKLVIEGSGSQVRDFIHVDDVCRAIYQCMMREECIEEPVDVGTGKGTSILDLVEMLDKEFTFNLNSDIIGTEKSVADPKMAKDLFGFEYKIELKGWIDETLKQLGY